MWLQFDNCFTFLLHWHVLWFTILQCECKINKCQFVSEKNSHLLGEIYKENLLEALKRFVRSSKCFGALWKSYLVFFLVPVVMLCQRNCNLSSLFSALICKIFGCMSPLKFWCTLLTYISFSSCISTMELQFYKYQDFGPCFHYF